ncbi:sugar transporter ERD6-like 5 isoform X2 [Panicum hallii]|uniref:sugar transporter ERD6-like 5 isoform X2 n=1 Tax=Panicum hallii TaxID=206008 RepID=UPI000DF4D1A9|nr:sugar transporter ERD6-like 5 isoform X2 [Panicum hallii]
MALPAPPRMAATLPSSAVAPALLLRRHTGASLSSRCRRRWQRPAARRREGPGAPLGMRGARELPPAAPDRCSGARGATPAAAAAGEAPYRGSEAQGSLWMVLLATAVVVCGSLEFGTCVGYSAPAQAGIVGDIGLSNSEYGVFASVLAIGAMIGALTSGRLADVLGRKMTMRFAAVVGIFGWLTVYFAKDAIMLYAGRVLLGYCTGVLSYVVPVFISEIAPKDIRGGLATSNQLFICLGCSAAYIIGALLSWRSLVVVGLVPCVVLLVGLFFIPESPRWLANIGREKEFHASLQKFRGKDYDISEEATEIKGYIESNHRLPKARIQDLFQRENIYAVTVSEPDRLFSPDKTRFQSHWLGPFSWIGVEEELFFWYGHSKTDLAYTQEKQCDAQGLYSQLVPSLALCGILVYYAAYSVGMGPVPWVIMSEIFSINMKAIAGGLVTLVSWIGSFAISYSFNFLMGWNPAGTFFLFSAASLVTVLFVAKLVPETKGRTLEEIQASLQAST